MKIRQEDPKDYNNVYTLIKAAFETATHNDGTEQDLVVSLRTGDSFIPELSFVATEHDEIIGHIMFTKAQIGDSTELALAPLSISPNHQKKGIGTALMHHGHNVAKEMGYEFSVVLGSEEYYPRVGYQPASEFGIYPPFEVPSENFMALNLNGNHPRLNATLAYAKEFGL